MPSPFMLGLICAFGGGTFGWGLAKNNLPSATGGLVFVMIAVTSLYHLSP